MSSYHQIYTPSSITTATSVIFNHVTFLNARLFTHRSHPMCPGFVQCGSGNILLDIPENNDMFIKFY